MGQRSPAPSSERASGPRRRRRRSAPTPCVRLRRRVDLAAATDEASLIELAGGTVLLEEVEEPNLKVTTAADLAVVDALLSRSPDSLG